MITLEWGVVVAVVGILVGMGVGWGVAGAKLSNVDIRLGKIEEMLSDGNEAVFARRSDMAALKELAQSWKAELNARIDIIEKRRVARR